MKEERLVSPIPPTAFPASYVGRGGRGRVRTKVMSQAATEAKMTIIGIRAVTENSFQ